MAKISFVVSKDLLARMEAEAERRAGEDGEQMEPGALAEFLVTYALNRIDVLAKHAAKVAAVKAAKDAGKKLPKGIEFKRYVPTFTDKALDAAGTEHEVAVWAHKAPVRVAKVEPKPPKAAPAKVADKLKANEARIKEIEAKLKAQPAKPAPAARPPVVRKAAPAQPAKPGIKTARAEGWDAIPVC